MSEVSCFVFTLFLHTNFFASQLCCYSMCPKLPSQTQPLDEPGGRLRVGSGFLEGCVEEDPDPSPPADLKRKGAVNDEGRLPWKGGVRAQLCQAVAACWPVC